MQSCESVVHNWKLTQYHLQLVSEQFEWEWVQSVDDYYSQYCILNQIYTYIYTYSVHLCTEIVMSNR